MTTGVNVGTAYVPVVPEMSQFATQTKAGVSGATTKLSSTLKTAGAAIGIGLGAAFVIGFAKKSLAAVQEADKINSQLARAFEPLGDVGAKMLQPIIDWAGELQFELGIDDEAIKQVAGRLAIFGDEFFKAVGPNAAGLLEKLTLGFEDMAAATGKQVTMLMRSLGPAILNTPEKAIATLEKYHTLTDEQIAQVKELTAAGDDQAATQLIINALSEKYAGAAAAAATPSEKLAVAVGEIQESFGRLLLPIVQVGAGMAKWAVQNIKLVGLLTAVTAATILWFSVLKDSAIMKAIVQTVLYAKAIATVALEQGILSAVQLVATQVWYGMIVPIAALLVELLPVIAAIAAVAFVVTVATGKLNGFQKALDELVPKVKKVVETMMIMKNTGVSWAVAAKLQAKETDNLRVHLTKAGTAARNFANMTGKALNDFKKGVHDSVQVAIGDFKNVGEAFKTTANQLKNQARAAVRIAETEHADLKKIFADKSLTEGQKAALASLPADQRHAWVEAGTQVRAQIAEDAHKLLVLNRQNFATLTADSEERAGDGGDKTGSAYIDKMISAIGVKTPALMAAAENAVNQAIAAGLAAAGQGGTGDTGDGGRDGDPTTPFSKGGIVTRPTRALIGESGPEAVIPLERLQTTPSSMSIRITNWRDGIGELDHEMAWNDPRR